MQFDNQKTRNVADVVARILAGESAQQEPKMLEEELKGNQHKIDANKNNKIDAHDFKLLRAKKKVEEETEELTESHFKVGDEVICKASGMEGEVVKVDPKEEGKYYTVKREDGKMVKYAPDELKKEEEDEDEDEKEMKEEVEELQELDEPTLSKYATRAKFSSNPKHREGAAKAQEKLEKKKEVKEDVEELDELSKSTLASYAKKASRDARMKYATGKDFERHARTSRKPEYKAGAKEWEDKYKSDARRREAGVGKAIDRLAKEEVEELDEAMFPGTKEYEKKYGQSPQQKLRKKGDTVPTSQGDMTKTDKGIAHRRRFTEMIDLYQEHGLKFVASLVQEEPDNEEYTKEVEDQKAKMDGKKKGGDVAKASVQAVKNEETEIQVINADIANGVDQIDIEERSLTEPEMKKKEEIVKSMKKGMAGFKQRYGDRAKEVMYATATARAKGE